MALILLGIICQVQQGDGSGTFRPFAEVGPGFSIQNVLPARGSANLWPRATASCSRARPGLPGLAGPGLHEGAPGQPAVLTLETDLTCSGLAGWWPLVHSHTNTPVPAKPKTALGTLRKSRFPGNFTAFVHELL
ncbi:hypothetical protein HJG60_008763 [Phyllostomus discolor]|uniref:Uncharacterized protein n=1 Tax=Phyllostomus discolor TaxID=89673 RepID=A0A833YTZ6_9CHIR|nr:hypothetical protein HJG60_008763 [Phyllostomus discolor]